MPKRISYQLKEEARVLALKPFSLNEIVGVVFRGKYWVDGVLVIRFKDKVSSEKLARAIISSKYFHELRILLFDYDMPQIDIHIVYETTKLPVIRVDCLGSVEASAGIDYLSALQALRSLVLDDVIQPLYFLRALTRNLRCTGILII